MSIYIALPSMDEFDYLFLTMEHLNNQTNKDFTFVVCINQPESYRNSQNEEHLNIVKNNEATLTRLYNEKDNYNFKIEIVDKCSTGCGWTSKKHGVGWARKIVMDKSMELSKENESIDKDIIVCLDADTECNNNYLETIIENFNTHKDIVAISVPVFHKLTGNKREDHAILRYEIYLRYYALNIWRINSFYSFTAVGSAIAVPIKVYKKISGITPKLSGEDFYFLQKLRKYGKILQWNKEKIYPAARFSSRVFFGTGPSMIKGDTGDWSSHPIYDYKLFDQIKETTDLFSKLYTKDYDTKMISFLKAQLGENLWQPLRNNSKTSKQFVKFCNEKIDGLRILQFLKSHNDKLTASNEENLKTFVNNFFPESNFCEKVNELTTFDNASIELLDNIRLEMVNLEDQIYKKQKWCF